MTSQAQWASALLNPRALLPAGLDTWNGSDIDDRFAVYRNNVVVSLVQSLADTYPVCQALVGAEFFAAMAREFVWRDPPRSPVLHEYGAMFSVFIESFAPAAPVPYLADVARLEWSRLQVLHAADHQGAPRERLLDLFSDPARLQSARLMLAPCVATIDSPYAVRSIWAAHHGHGDMNTVDVHQPESTWVIRSDLDCLLIGVDPGAHLLLTLLRHGGRIVDAAASTLAAFPHCAVTDHLGSLIEHGVITDILD